ncbi:hypothetical protein PIB30_105914, partial [Stylosanthes scabra]|nr:hypothetical protein [Stylosanthes scabra]
MFSNPFPSIPPQISLLSSHAFFILHLLSESLSSILANLPFSLQNQFQQHFSRDQCQLSTKPKEDSHGGGGGVGGAATSLKPNSSGDGETIEVILTCYCLTPEIEITLRRARQVRHRVQFEEHLRSQVEELTSDNNSVYSSASETNFELSSSDPGTSVTGDNPRLTLKQLGGASTALENQPSKYPELNANFELKSGLINLLPKFHG